MHFRAWRPAVVAVCAVLVLIVGSAGQAFACVAPENSDNLDLSTSVGFASLTPTISLTLAVDKPTAIPGNKLTYSVRVTNSGTILRLTGRIEISNPSRRSATVASWFDFLSVDPKGRCGDSDEDGAGRDRDHWTPIAGVAGARSGYSPSRKPPISSGMNLTAVAVPAAGVTYATGSDTITGTSIARGATARWDFTAVVPLTPTQAKALFRGSEALPIRQSFHAEPSTGNSVDSDSATLDNANFCRQLGAFKYVGNATDVRVSVTLPNGTVAALNSSNNPALGSISPGASATATTSYTVPVPAAKGAGETDAAYLSRLAALDGSRLAASASAKVGTGGSSAGPVGSVIVTESVPVLSLVKSGPASVDAGGSASYSLAMANRGSAPAASLTLADTLPAGTVIPTSGVPASLAPGATATASAAYAVPAAQTPGDLTDTATLRWTDANANSYGPISSQATSRVTRPIATVTVTAWSGSMTYGGTVPVITPAYSGWVNGEGPAVLTTAPTCSTTATSASGAGAYKTSCAGAAAPYYTFVYVDGSVTVNPARVTVTASSGSMTYGGTVPVITPAYSGWVNGDGPAVLTRAPLCSTIATSASAAGAYVSSCSGAAAANYTFGYVGGAVSVGRAIVTVAASSGSMTYGGTVPVITPAYSGWVNGDGPSVLTTAPTCSTTARSSSGVGTYGSTCTVAVAPNYTFVYVDGSVKVNPALVTVTASSGSMTYGGTVPVITPSYSGWVNGDGPSVLTTAPTCTTTTRSASPAGTYSSSCSGAAAANYTFGYVDGMISVDPSVVIVTASSGSLTYGGTVPAITPSYSGWLNGDGPAVLTTAPVCTTAATSASGVGTYKTSCSGAAAPNYTFSYADGTITVTPALVTLTAPSGSMTYGGAVPAIAPSYSDWVNGDGPSVLTTAPTCSTTATSASGVGTYQTTCSGAAAPNYTFSYIAGNVTVNPALITVTASSGSMIYGGTVPVITPAYSGWVNGEGPSVLTTAPTCSTAATSASPAGTYGSSCSGAAAPNYTFSYIAGSVTVNPALITVTASSGSMIYGGTVPVITPAYSGWVNGEGPSVLTTAPTCSTAATSASPAGTYKTSCSGAAAPNYTFSYVDGTISVNGVTTTSLTLSPQSGGSLPLNSSYTFTVTATDSNGQPVSGAAVALTVAGPNATTANLTTGADGTAMFTYTGTVSGTDTAQATANDGTGPISSNTTAVIWFAPAAPVSTSVIHGSFFTTPALWTTEFTATPSDTPVFQQDFPNILFNPKIAIPGNDSGVNWNSNPFTDVTTDFGGHYTGTVVAQGNGVVAATGSLPGFNAVFTGSYTVAAAGNVTFLFNADDGFIFGVGGGATYVSGMRAWSPTNTPFKKYPVMGAWNWIAQNWTFGSTVYFPAPGVYPFEVDYLECCGGQAAFTMTQADGLTPFPSTVGVSLNPIDSADATLGSTKSFTASVLGPDGKPLANQPVSLLVNGTDALVLHATTDAAGLAHFTYSRSHIDTDRILAVTDFGGIEADSNTVTQLWVAQPTNPPSAASIGPADGTIVTVPTPITATITPPDGQTIDHWAVTYKPLGGTADPVTIASGSGTPPPTIATFDPTVLPNGGYLVNITAIASGGGGISADINLFVEGNLKLGRYGVTYQDASVAVGGIPMQATRTYDSFDKSTGAFGVGWQLGVANFRVYTNGPLGAGGWSQYATSCFMAGFGGGLCQMAWTTARPHFVTVVWPDGHTETFDFTPTGGSNLFWLGSASFTARAGSTSTLSPVGDASLSYKGDGNLYAGLSGSTVYAPARFRLTAKDGTVYLLDIGTGLVSEADRTGNSVTVDAAGIHSSLGPSLTFVRDGSGRITELDKPDGSKVSYVYDTAGDLVSVTDERGNTVTYQYDSNHNLTKTIDPTGHPFSTVAYDSSGRISSITDATGNTTAISSDPSLRTQTVTDAAGRQTTISSFNSAGDLVQVDVIADGATATTKYAYDANHNVTSRTDPAGGVWAATYDSANNLTSFTDAAGNKVGLTYDAYGYPLTWTDPNGGVTTYKWNTSGTLASVTDALGQVESYTYDATGNMLTRTDRSGKVWHYAYDSAGRLASRTDPVGNSTSYTYDGAGRLATAKDADGGTTTYAYDAAGHLLSTTDPEGGVTAYAYDTLGFLSSVTDPAGKVTTYGRDAAGRVTSVTDPTGAVTHTSYDAAGHTATTTDAAGNVTTYTYDGFGNLATTKDALGRTTSYKHDLRGLLTSSTNAAGGATTYEYDATGNQTGVTDPDGHVSKTAYGPHGEVTSSTDPAGAITTYAYDLLGRQAKVTDPTGRASITDYTPTGAVADTKDPAGAVTSYGYDDAGREVTATDPNGNVTTYGLDPAGRMTSVTDAAGNTRHTVFDAAGRVSSATSAAGVKTTYAYDPRGLTTKVTDALGGATAYAYDDAGRTTSTTDPRGATTTYAYDPRGLQTKITDALGHSVGFGYDAAGQQTSLTDADGQVWKTAYDNLGNVASATDPLGHTATYVHDAAGVLTSSTNANGITTTYTYNTADHLAALATPTASITTTYDTAGRRATMTDPLGLTTYAYDPAGRLASIAGPGANVAYTYDPAGNRATVTAAGRTTTYTYDAAERLASVSQPGLGTFGFTYNPDGQLTTLTRPNGVTSTNTYDAGGRLTGLTYKNSGGTLVAAYTYTLDPAGNRTSATTSGSVSGSGTEHYTLDPAGRLTGVTYADGTAVTFGYDPAGNRTSMTSGGDTTAYTYNAASELTAAGSTSYSYDPAGNRLTAGSTAYAYDSFGNLASETSGAVSIAYQTNGSGLRVSASAAGSTTAYNWDAAAALPALLSDGTNGYLSADTTLLATTAGSSSSYPLTDALGSVRAQTDSSGSLTASASYGVFGSTASGSGSVGSLGYTGALTDSSGLVYLQARSLDPATGTMLSRDPETPGGPGVTGFNPYAYAGQNSVTLTDPSGRGMAEMTVTMVVAEAVVIASAGLLSWLLMYELANCMVVTRTCHVPDVRAPWDNPTSPTNPWDLPWEQVGRNLAKLTTALAQVALAACVTSAAAGIAARFLGKDPSGVCSGSEGPVFFTGFDSPEATMHDLTALATHPQWTELTYTARKLGDWYSSAANRPNPCSVELARLKANGQYIPGKWACDEFPFGSTAQGGPGSDLKLIDSVDNSTQGGLLSSFYGSSGCNIPPDSGPASMFLVVPVPVLPTLWVCGRR